MSRLAKAAYHGTPITPNAVLQALGFRDYCVSYYRPDQVEWIDANARSWFADNGIFSAWMKGTEFSDACFSAALTAVRNFGGVLEHPWGSHAWSWFGLTVPDRRGGWVRADQFGGWTCCVEQGRYGHYARKPTLLYAVGCDLPELAWGHSPMNLDPAVVERMGLERAKRLGEVGARGGGTDSTPRIHTPEPFRDLLIGMARSVRRDELPLFRSAA